MKDATRASQESLRAELTVAQETITQLTQEIAASRKESDGKTNKLEEMTKKLDDMKNTSDGKTKKLEEMKNKLDNMTKKSDDTTKKLDEITKKVEEMKKELRAERRQTKYLQEYITKLQAKYDGSKRHADQQEADHDELQARFEETEERLSQALRLKNQAVAKALQAESRRKAKADDLSNLKSEFTVLTKLYQDTQMELDQPHHRELRLTKADQKRMVESTRRVVQCTQCYTKKWPCDGGDTCQACTVRGIGQNCKRVKCQFWARGTCKKGQCGLAHEGDGYPSVIEHRKLHQKAMPMPEAVARTLVAPAPLNPANAATFNITFPRHMNTDPDPEGGRSLIFETFTVLPEFSMRSLEEARYGDYMLGNRWEHRPAK